MKLEVVPTRFKASTRFVLRVIKDGVVYYYSQNYSLSKQIHWSGPYLKVISFKDPNRFQELIKDIVMKMRWDFDPTQKLIIRNRFQISNQKEVGTT